MDRVPVAKKPRQVICFKHLEILTDKGPVYLFSGLDVISEFVFRTGIEQDFNKKILLKHITLLMQDKDFKRFHYPFVLVLPAYEEFREEINTLLRPYGGKLAVNKDYVERRMQPFEEYYLKILRQRAK